MLKNMRASEMEEQNHPGYVDLDILIEFVRNRLPEYQIVNCYLFGSRCYGYARPDSDWDFLCIVSGDYFPGALFGFIFIADIKSRAQID